MDLPLSKVAIFEENQTRADLYALWLDDHETTTVVTKRGVEEAVDQRLAVAVINQSFGDGAAASVNELLTSSAPLCRVIETRERSEMFPDLDTDHHLVAPVFEEDLVARVRTLLSRANYHFAIGRYYQTSIELSSIEISDDEAGSSDEDYESLRDQLRRFQHLIAALRGEMTEEDVEAVKDEISFKDPTHGQGTTEPATNKYQPDHCSNCGEDWDSSSDDAAGVVQLGAYVWRCLECGNVKMLPDPSHRDVARYR